ncbi:hypothetical protein HYALB_00012166 [Hymenoscyphus albidus]|uniref:Heterokaryon incompatibility domain-containing protein n=1 Tax=Hymenoscyphus albidus TaxID=595503 RepID=A0A9N9Q8D3_9HELO|nr:hypothetical protein HYALB_00012166 [Hymenoscyphus albidus]
MSDPWTSKVCDLCGSIFSSTENLKCLVSQSSDPNRLLIPREIRQFSRSGENGCKLCKKIWQAMQKLGAVSPMANFHFNLAFWAFEPRSANERYRHFWTGIEQISNFAQAGGRSLEIGHFEVYASSDDPASTFIDAIPPDFEVGSTQSSRAANEWLQDCVANHEKCPSSASSPLPTRVLDVCPNYGLEKLRLYASNGAKDQYAALSYCWGGPQPIVTTLASLESHQKSLVFEELPRTIRDAIIVTRELGIRYLWIDALCIIQDSLEDKGRELDKMGGIYKNAFLTISASSAASCKDGFLQTRIPDHPPERFLLPFRCPDETMGSVIIQSEVDEGIRTLPAIDKRGWTFQERSLSPRLLIYGEQGLSFECQTEEKTNGGRAVKWKPWDDWRANNPIFTKPDTSNEGEIEKLQRAWCFMVENYASRSLTFPEDKLTAISGVAGEFKRFFRGDEYMAGLWKGWILEGLGWFVNTLGDGRIYPRPKEYRAPSWSWASVDGNVIYAFKYDMGPSSFAEGLKFVSCKVEPAPLNRVSGGELVLEGRLRPALWDVKSLNLTKIDGESADCYTPLDAIENVTCDKPLDVWCLQVRRNQGMILRKIEEGVYQRKGWFRTKNDGSWFEHCETVILKIL